jgi:hypothetical protein
MHQLMNGTEYFRAPVANATAVLAEVACEPEHDCDQNQVAFKGLLARWVTKSKAMLPGVGDGEMRIRPIWEATAAAAAASFSASPAKCVGKWWGPVGGESSGPGDKATADDGPNMGACLATLEVVESLLGLRVPPFYYLP